jgi:tetratricopeptide (TPR) repeat protein
MFDSLLNLALDKFAFISQPASSKTWLSSEQMRLILLICAVCLLALAFGCKRSGQQSANNSTGPAAVSNDLAANRGQARELLTKGKELYRNDQDTEAVEAFQQALKLDPDLAEAHFRLGLGYEALGKQEEAEAEYKKAVASFKKYLEENDNDPEAHYDLGQTYAGLGQYSEAIREYRQATKLKEDDPDIYYDLGLAHTKLAQYDAAAAAFSKSLEIDPDNYRAEDGLAEAKEGIKRIKVGRKHQEDLLKKKKEDESKKAGASPTP